MKKLKGYKILIDANVLVSASILYVCKEFGLKDALKHQFYDTSKSLINLFERKIDEKMGIYTRRVDITSNRVLSTAILSTIKNVSNNPEIKKEKLLEVFSIIYSECLRRLEKNKDCLILETVNQNIVNKWMQNEVFSFLNIILPKEIEKHNPNIELERVKKLKATSQIMKMVKFTKFEEARRYFPHYYILKRKFLDSKPGTEDVELLSQAIYFKDLYSKQNIKFYFASTDQHFVEVSKDGIANNFVPNRIKEKFDVECLKPEKILDIIK